MTPPHRDGIDSIILSRRSIRKYKPDIPSSSLIESMLLCAATAPSPSNSQPVRYFRINSPDIRANLHRTMIERKEELLQQLKKEGGPAKTKNLINASFRYSEFMFEAPVIIAVGTATDTAGFSKKLAQAKILPKDLRGDTDLDITVGLSLMAFIIKGHSLGLGTCILTAPLLFLTDVEKMPGMDGVIIKCFIAVGFPDETPGYVHRKGVSEIYKEI
jgi:nitroreductase